VVLGEEQQVLGFVRWDQRQPAAEHVGGELGDRHDPV
jgi:hypothetical protein